jgi:hypothetical protein
MILCVLPGRRPECVSLSLCVSVSVCDFLQICDAAVVEKTMSQHSIDTIMHRE